MKGKHTWFLIFSLVLVFQVSVYAAPEDDNPDFYADVSWSIPSGMEGYTVPTKFIPSTDGTTGHFPILKDNYTSLNDFKNFHEYIRDYTEGIISGASTPEEAAKRLFYEVRDNVKVATNRFYGAMIALKLRFGLSNDKATLLAAALRSAKVPARIVMIDGVMNPSTLNYNREDYTQDPQVDVIPQSAAGTSHVYCEAYINGSWVSLDPTWSSDLAYAFDIAAFGEKENSIATSGTPTNAVDYPDKYLKYQSHPYLLGKNIKPSQYEEDSEYENFAYFEPKDDFWSYLNAIKYKTLVADMGGTIRYALAECDEVLDMTTDSFTRQKITEARGKLIEAQEKLANGSVDSAKGKLKGACGKIAALPGLYDDLDLMSIRVALANHWRAGEVGIIMDTESYPRTFDAEGIIWNAYTGYTYKYGWGWETHPCVPLDFSNFGYYPNNDTTTYAKDPTRMRDYTYTPFTPTLLMDVQGNLYDPATTNYTYQAGRPTSAWDLERGGHYFILDDQGANGLGDWGERATIASWNRAEIVGGGDETELMNTWFFTRAMNRVYDEYDDVIIRYATIYRNNEFEDAILRIIDAGIEDLVSVTLFSSYADYSHSDVLNWIPEIIASSSNPAVNFIPPTNDRDVRFGYKEEFFDGFFQYGAITEELMKASGDVAVWVVTHGFTTQSRFYAENWFPSFYFSDPCAYLTMIGMGQFCPYVSPCMPAGFLGYPTGAVYGEDNYHTDADFQFDELKARIEAAATQNPAITDLRVYNVYSHFGRKMQEGFDPSALSWGEAPKRYDVDFPFPGDTYMWGNALSPNEAYQAALLEGTDYIIDWMFYWHSPGRDQLEGHRRALPIMDMVAGVPGIPDTGAWPHDRNDYTYWDENYRTELVTSDGIRIVMPYVGMGGPDLNWAAVDSLFQQLVQEIEDAN
jgi:transglutaminase-like putative cysteine protease